MFICSEYQIPVRDSKDFRFLIFEIMGIGCGIKRDFIKQIMLQEL